MRAGRDVVSGTDSRRAESASADTGRLRAARQCGLCRL